MTKFQEGQMVKLLETIIHESHTYEVGHPCSVLCVLLLPSDDNETRYLVEGDIFDPIQQEYSSPFIVKESQLENNDILFQSDF